MVSRKQLKANRRNALKSTGPKTPEGKAKVALNAVKHGLTAEHVLVSDENQEQYEAFRDSLAESLQPEGAMECLLVERIITAAWRLRRTTSLEREITNRRYESSREYWKKLCSKIEEENAKAKPIYDDQDDEYEIEGDDAFEHVELELKEFPPEPVSAGDAATTMDNSDFYGKLSRYEAHIERGMYRALHELERRQAARNNKQVAPPPVVDININGMPERE